MFKKRLVNKGAELEAIIEQLKKDKKESNKTVSILRESLNIERVECKRLNKLVREQTEGDLLLVSMKILKDILEDKKENIPYLISQQDALQSRLAGLQQQAMSNNTLFPGLGGLLR